MNFDKERIEFLINYLNTELSVIGSMDNQVFINKNNEIKKILLLLTMLHELDSLSSQDVNVRLSSLKLGLIFSCVSKGTLKSMGFKFFILNKFGVQDLQESDWDAIREELYRDIRWNLPNKINALEYEHKLESNRKDLVELKAQLKKLQEEYKTYWFRYREMDLKISGLNVEIEEKKIKISDFEEKILSNINLLDAVNLWGNALFDEGDRENLSGRDAEIVFGLGGAEMQGFDAIKAFCQLISKSLISYFNDEGEYSRQYNAMINGLHENMLQKVETVVGYRLSADIDDEEKNYPHISNALMEAFMGSLDTDESDDDKKYFIKCGYPGQRMALDLQLRDRSSAFKNMVSNGIYIKTISKDRLGLENKIVINAVQENLERNKKSVEELLMALSKNLDVDFMDPDRLRLSEKTLSSVDDIFHLEHELLIFLSDSLRNNGYIVSNQYIAQFIFEQRLQNLMNARLEQVDSCVSDYLDTGLALPLITTIFPENAPETEEEAKKLLYEMLENPYDDRLCLIIASAMANHALIRADEKINRISNQDNDIFVIPKAQWIDNLTNHIFFGEELCLPNAVTMHIDAQGREKLNQQFIEKLKSVYQQEINQRKQNLIERISVNLSALPNQSLESVEQWRERIQDAIIRVCLSGRIFREAFSDALHGELFDSHIDLFIEKFDINTVFVYPTYPLNVNEIAASSKRVVHELMCALGIQEGSQEYPLYYSALMKSYNHVLFEWECGEIKKLLKKATSELNVVTHNLSEKRYYESFLDFLVESVKKTIKAAVAVGGTSFLLGMTPQALLCVALLQAMANVNPIIAIAVFILCYKYILPRLLSDNANALLEKYENAVLSAFNIAMLPIFEFVNNVQSLLQAKFPNNREKLTKMLISFVSVLVGAAAFIYCPVIIPAMWVTGAVNISPLIFAYAAAAFTFFVSSLYLEVSYNAALEEKIKNMLSDSLRLNNLEVSELEFLKLFTDLGKGNDFLKEFENFLSIIKNKPKDTQAKAFVHFIEAKTLDLLADLPLSILDEKLDGVNKIINDLKNLSVTLLQNVDNPESQENHESIEQLKIRIQTLAGDAPRHRCRV